MIRWLLFETRLGDRFLAWLERTTGLMVVVIDLEVESLDPAGLGTGPVEPRIIGAEAADGA
jgi:hypothetical protein